MSAQSLSPNLNSQSQIKPDQENLPSQPDNRSPTDKNAPTNSTIKVIVKRKLKEHPCFLFWASLFSIVFISSANVPFFLFSEPLDKVIYFGVSIVVSTPIFIVSSCQLADTKRDALKLYFLFDNITIAYCTAAIGYIGILTIIFTGQAWMMIVGSILIAVNNFIFQGTCKVMLAYGKYSFSQTICLKFSLMIGMLTFLVLAAHFMRNSFDTFPIDEDSQDSLQQFFFLYIFGLFTLYMEIFSKANDLDGGNELQYYHLINHEGEEEEKFLYENDDKNHA